MVDLVSLASSLPSPTPTPFPAAAPPVAAPTGAFEDRLGDATQITVGAIEEFRPRVTAEIAREGMENRMQRELLTDQVASVEARYRRLLAEGGDDVAIEAAAGNLRLETKRLIAVEQRAYELADVAQRDRYATRAGNALGVMMSVTELVAADRDIAEEAKTNPRGAWRKAIGTALGVMADGVLSFSRVTGGGLKGGVLDVGLGSAVRRLGERIADATFDPLNRMAHELAKKPWWPKGRAPRTPIDPSNDARS